MLIIIPPSESKRPPPIEGDPLRFDALSFPSLTATRRRIVEALAATSAGPDPFRRLHTRSSKAEDVARNTALFDLPTRPVLDVYTGPFHEGLDAGSWSSRASERAERELVVTSAVWGALRPADRIPAYRCHICARLEGMDRLEPTWRAVLPGVLADAAGPGAVVLDLRSPTYQAAGTPTGLADRTVTLRIRDADRERPIGDVVAKRVRGQAARTLLESNAPVHDPHDLVGILADRWSLDVEPPDRSGHGWTVTLQVPREDR